ncbi:LIM domain and actin-binding protein 1-like isoform X2 [Corticium candelabrum]|uniref:LIM domain and actin-binding protein 1-like isoform X2 n=1 Tax=Corticium candelabrum TaxID=121492 RepID=UPI002E26469B|nr:LIM domain and actin-binding protein 1-like isoform X2 [Corticium candelabrum]
MSVEVVTGNFDCGVKSESKRAGLQTKPSLPPKPHAKAAAKSKKLNGVERDADDSSKQQGDVKLRMRDNTRPTHGAIGRLSAMWEDRAAAHAHQLSCDKHEVKTNRKKKSVSTVKCGDICEADEVSTLNEDADANGKDSDALNCNQVDVASSENQTEDADSTDLGQHQQQSQLASTTKEVATTHGKPRDDEEIKHTKGENSNTAAIARNGINKEAARLMATIATNKTKTCVVCEKAVYHMEKLEVDKQLFHKHCFKCQECKKTLSAGTYASLEGQIFCKPHFKQLFRLKGNYDEGFGRQQHKTKWN